MAFANPTMDPSPTVSHGAALQRIATVIDPVPPAHFLAEGMKDKRALRHHNSSTYGKLRPYPRPTAEHYDANIERRYFVVASQAPHRPSAHRLLITALTGGYENIPRHEHRLIGDADFHLVTDGAGQPGAGARPSTPRYFDRDPVRAARFVKTHPHLVAPNAKVAIWHDAKRHHPRRPPAANLRLHRVRQAPRNCPGITGDPPSRRRPRSASSAARMTSAQFVTSSTAATRR